MTTIIDAITMCEDKIKIYRKDIKNIEKKIKILIKREQRNII